MISVIVFVHNSEDYLHNCLNSILKQTYQNFEVICVTNNSEDSSKDILEYFTLKDSRIKIIDVDAEKEECKNKALEMAQGKYIAFLKSNEWISSSTLEILVNHAEENNLDLIFYNNDLNHDGFKVYNSPDLDITSIESKNWSKFYLKSALVNEDSVERIFFINQIFKSSQKLNNTSENLSELIRNQHLNQVKNQLNKLEASIQNQHQQTESFADSQENINELIINQLNELEVYIQNQQNQTKSFIDSQRDLNNHLRNSANLTTRNYNESRRYFFNNQEPELKKYFDTDDLFNICYYNNFKFLSYSPAENRILIKTDDNIVIGSNNRFYTIKEVIGFNGYSIPQLYDFDDFIVFDVGMNRAYASLWFAKFDSCRGVHGFEIDPETYDKALSNINLNPQLSAKIKAYNFGLSDKDGEVDLFYVNGCDGVNTMFSEVADLQGELKDKSKVQTKKVQVKKASDILSKIIEDENITSKIVLKIDTEGAEYDIIKDLIESGFILKIDVLLGEGHVFDREHYCDKLKELGFRQVDLQINPVTYNFAFVKDVHFKVWPLKE